MAEQLAQLQQWAVEAAGSGGDDAVTWQQLADRLAVLLPRQRTVTFEDLC